MLEHSYYRACAWEAIWASAMWTQTHCTYTLIRDWPWLRCLGKEIDSCSIVTSSIGWAQLNRAFTRGRIQSAIYKTSFYVNWSMDNIPPPKKNQSLYRNQSSWNFRSSLLLFADYTGRDIKALCTILTRMARAVVFVNTSPMQFYLVETLSITN